MKDQDSAMPSTRMATAHFTPSPLNTASNYRSIANHISLSLACYRGDGRGNKATVIDWPLLIPNMHFFSRNDSPWCRADSDGSCSPPSPPAPFAGLMHGRNKSTYGCASVGNHPFAFETGGCDSETRLDKMRSSFLPSSEK